MIPLLWMKSMVQRKISKRKGVNNMKLSRKELLKAITLVDQSTNTIITAYETWDNNVGMVVRGFITKANMPENEFKEAMGGDPGEYIRMHTEGRWELLSIDETLNLINDPSSNFSVLFWRVGVFTM